MGSYRDRLQIISDILSIASTRAKKTQIMYQANLSYRLLCQYLEVAMKADLICFEDENCFILTKKGKDFLDRYQEYSKRRRLLENNLNDMEGERASLEMMCSRGDLSYTEENNSRHQKRWNKSKRFNKLLFRTCKV